MDTANYRFRVLKPLAGKLGIEKLNFQIMGRTMATQAQNMGSVKDIQEHLRHSRADTTANEYLMLAKGKEDKTPITNLPQNATNESDEVPASY